MSHPAVVPPDAPMDPTIRRRILREALAVAIATAAVGLSFGAIAVAAGFSVGQASVLSALAFTGASQFVFVAVLGDGGTAASAISVALLLGSRNGLYAVGMTPLMRWRGWRRLLGAHLTIDETTAMATARDDRAQARLAFWATGILLWTLWNLSTIAGALAGDAVGSPESLGLDVAFPAAFVALIGPQLRTRRTIVTAIAAVTVALLLVPFASLGVTVLAPALVVVPIALWWRPEWERRV